MNPTNCGIDYPLDTFAHMTDFAFVIHVRQFDAFDCLVTAAGNLPLGVDRFVIIPEAFSAEEQARVAKALPGAVVVPVEGGGHGIGALFHLMEKFDLGRYDFICRIHDHQGTSMPEVWRRALFDGVLGSTAQVDHIIARFRADPQLMLAGARQLFLYGPSYLLENENMLFAPFAPMIGVADIRKMDWGFVAGACFWIRTSVLTRMAACEPRLCARADLGDAPIAHAAEWMFGLTVALAGGKVLLQDLRFSDRFPSPETGFPAGLPRVEQPMSRILTPLAVNLFVRPRRAPVTAVLQSRRRVAVFASYSSNGMLPPQVIPYLKGLKPLISDIVVVCDNDLLPEEREKLSGFSVHVITGRHGEYDFGSYKRGIAWLRETGRLENADALVLCNDSCFGPVGSFEPMFATMEAKGLDFWGAVESHEFSYHLQSYFVVFSRKVIASPAFHNFISGIEKQPNVEQVIQEYELGMTRVLTEAGFRAGALLDNPCEGAHAKDPTYRNPTFFPLYTLERGLPLVKVKALREPRNNADGPNRVLDWFCGNAPETYACATSDLDIAKFEDSNQIAFSIIMPTHDRVWCIAATIDAVLAQTHQNFELLIVDDGSNDGTETMIRDHFASYLAVEKIRYIRLKKRVGVRNARKIGRVYARNHWIAYADSDHEVRPYYLAMIANSIIRYPDVNVFYAQTMHINTGKRARKQFKKNALLGINFIDRGIFAYRRRLATSPRGLWHKFTTWLKSTVART